MENTVKDELLSLRLDELSVRSRIIEKLRGLNSGPRETRSFCENDLGYSAMETRSVLAILGFVLMREQMISENPSIQLKIDKLREWRAKRARRDAVPAYRILTNKTIMNLANEGPTDFESLRSIKGWGDKSRAAYGSEVIDLLRS